MYEKSKIIRPLVGKEYKSYLQKLKEVKYKDKNTKKKVIIKK